MRIQTRIVLLLLLTILVFIGVSLGYQFIKKQQLQIFIKTNQEAENLIIDNNIKFKSQIYLGPVNDYSCWDEMINYIKSPTKEWEDVNLTTLNAFDLSSTWIYNSDYKLIYSTFDKTLLKEEIFINKKTIEDLFGDDKNEYCHYFLNIRDTLFEVTGATVVPSSDLDHKTTHYGYFFVGKFWGKDYIKQMENEMNFKISFRIPNDSINSNGIEESNIITKSFKDASGKIIMFVDFVNKNKIIDRLSSTDKLFYLLIVLLIITSLILIFAIHFWVNNPLRTITKSLSNENNTPIFTLVNRKNEFGEIARLISRFFEQKNKLENEVDARKEAQRTICMLYKDSVELNEQLEANKEELKTSIEELQSSKEELSITLETVNNLNGVLVKSQKEITDSINYASIIQAALLTPIEAINQLEHEFFILYKPHSIVSGDFYWLAKKGNKTYIAIADCTGHGVPGGFMSMLGMAYLDQIINLNCEQTTSEILDRLRDKVINSLHQNGNFGESKDGMDVALCIVDFENLTLQFSGANNPLYIVRDNQTLDKTTEFIELKGDRMPIGYSFRNVPFTNKEITLKENDILYFFTDGYQDQISNRTREKFKRKKIRNLLQGIYFETMDEQRNILELAFEGYRDEFPQIDDVLVFGLKV